MGSYHGYHSVIFGMRNSCQGKQHTYMVENWSFILVLLSGNQSQFNFEALIGTKANYEQQVLKPLIKVGANTVTQVVLGATLAGGGV